MNLGEFRKKTNHLPDNMDIVIKKVNDEFTYLLAESATIQDINFSEEEHSKVLATEKCLVLSDDIE